MNEIVGNYTPNGARPMCCRITTPPFVLEERRRETEGSLAIVDAQSPVSVTMKLDIRKPMEPRPSSVTSAGHGIFSSGSVDS